MSVQRLDLPAEHSGPDFWQPFRQPAIWPAAGAIRLHPGGRCKLQGRLAFGCLDRRPDRRRMLPGVQVGSTSLADIQASSISVQL